jgi:NADPH:quinone reductase-like Zn-dependent oxidoreductase
VSVNRGEPVLARSVPPGTVLGFDLAGVVLRTVEGGPTVGTPVSAFSRGAWAERAAVALGDLAVVPDGVGLAEAAALPMAGFSALRALRAGGALLGRRVLVTGASGGVGRYAVQLAALAGAFVIASVRSAERGKGLVELGAERVVTGLDGVEAPVDLVLDTVGGAQFAAAYGLLAPGGNLQSVGWASGEPAVLPPGALFSLGAARTISSFGDAERPGPDLAVLLQLLARGRLSAEVGWRGSWERVGDAYAAVFGGRGAGKAVLDVARA